MPNKTPSHYYNIKHHPTPPAETLTFQSTSKELIANSYLQSPRPYGPKLPNSISFHRLLFAITLTCAGQAYSSPLIVGEGDDPSLQVQRCVISGSLPPPITSSLSRENVVSIHRPHTAIVLPITKGLSYRKVQARGVVVGTGAGGGVLLQSKDVVGGRVVQPHGFAALVWMA